MMVEVPPVAPAECARIEDALVWACRAYDTLEGGSTLEGSSAEVLAAVRKNGLALTNTVSTEMPPLRFECQNAVPPTRGMGSSSAALVSGLAAVSLLGQVATWNMHRAPCSMHLFGAALFVKHRHHLSNSSSIRHF